MGGHVVAARFTPKKKTIRNKNSKFLLNPHGISCRITFCGDVWKLKCGLPNFTQIIAVYPCKPLICISPGEGAESGCFFSGNLPRTSTGLKQHISQ